jgi:hypothetical protein
MKPKTLFFIAVVALTIGGCSQNEQKDKAVQVSEKVKRDHARFLYLASQHHASFDWMESLPDRGRGTVFTVDLTQALIRTNGQPVATEAFLDDVSERDGVFTGHFTMFDFPSHHTFDLRLALRCSAQQTANLLKSEPTIGNTLFAVVATVESVSRPVFEATDSEAGDTYHIDFSSMPDVFFAKGTCIDLMPLDSGITK